MAFALPDAAKGGWVLPSRAAFGRFATQLLREHGEPAADRGAALQLFGHQRIAKRFLHHASPYRGLLLFHGLGSGKSCSAIVAAEALMAHAREVVVLLPASLHTNFIDEVAKCGNALFGKAQHWTFLPADGAEFERACASLGLDRNAQKRRARGVWQPSVKQAGAAAFGSLSDEQQAQIGKQIDDMIHRRYQVMHYNGALQRDAVLDDMLSSPEKNPFRGKVVIIDEVHNLVSRAAGVGATGKKLYQLLVTAPGAKIIALSGTPLINYPEELAYLIGLLKGYKSAFELTLSDDSVSPARVVDALHRVPELDLVDADAADKRIRFTRLPPAFRWADEQRTLVVLDDRSPGPADGDLPLVQRVVRELADQGVHVVPGAPPAPLVSTLPLDGDKFRAMFVDEENGAIRHPITLTNRLLGCISYYNSYSDDLYPTVHRTERVPLPLSAHQWLQYEDVRMTERRLESSGKRMSGMQQGADPSAFTDSSSTYRAFSRAVGNFAFPKDIQRPWPSSMREVTRYEMDDPDGGVREAEDPGAFRLAAGGGLGAAAHNDAYHKALHKALTKLRASARQTLVGEALAQHSPKYAAVVERVAACPGTALVYSQFRSVEGIGVLSMVWDAHGYAELQVDKDVDGQWRIATPPEVAGKPKYAVFTSDKERNKVLLAIFNSQFELLPARLRAQLQKFDTTREGKGNLHGSYVRVLHITQSGAEGISLRNVRQVHLLEPYWNQIRMDQVVGRAVRANSHKDLPSKERDVRVFMYVAVLTREQKESSATIRIRDDSLTSDEYVLNVATRKQLVMGQLLDLMKAAAVDCELHVPLHAGVTCHAPGQGDAGRVAAALEWGDLVGIDAAANAAREDAVLGAARQRAPLAHAKLVQYKGKEYVYDARTGTLYDRASFRAGRPVKVGRVDKAGKVSLVGGP